MSQFSPFEIKVADRVAALPPYLFGRINKMKYEKRVAGVDIIDLGMGNPTDPTPDIVVDKLAEAARDPRNHRYSVAHGIGALRKEIAAKYHRRYGVELNPDTETVVTIGSKEGFSHLCLALLGPGDSVIVGDPAFPIHVFGPAMAGATVIQVPLGNDEAFLARIEEKLATVKPTPKLVIFNYPHNPTSLIVDLHFWEKAVALCHKYKVMMISDFAYGEVNFDGYKAPSALQVDGAKECCVEFTTMSKSYNMAGWRVGYCCGNAQMVKALSTIKGYYDYGLFAPIQIASIVAMRHADQTPIEQSRIYARRRDVVCNGLDRLGWTYTKPLAGMFVWAKVDPKHLNSGEEIIDFTLRMMDEAAVALSPGRAFGAMGEGFVRIALVENEQRLKQALRNLENRLLTRAGGSPPALEQVPASH